MDATANGKAAAEQDAAASSSPLAIDAVFTWVDGADPVWIENKGALRRRVFGKDRDTPDDADNAARFRDNDELKYALRSLALFAPWIRAVHLLTADQKPAWLNTRTVNLVSHRDVFPEDVPLPVFSTRPIEFCVHRVPGLAEHFLYCNDDFLLGRPVSPGEFFRPDGTPLLWVLKRGEGYMRKVAGKLGGPDSHASAIARAHALIRERYGRSFPYIVRHYPRSMVRASAYALWEAFPEAIRKTLHSPFRSPSDVSVTILYPLFLLAEGLGQAKVVNGPRQFFDVVTGRGPAYMGASLGEKNTGRKMRLIRCLRPRAFCINDAPGASGADRRGLRDFLDAMFPEPCKYEITGG
ncbi:MAG: stealth family protein [Deltaproteobacteria bacterium]|nr:stealth family protein [Deltaproteobacteria bacterium]